MTYGEILTARGQYEECITTTDQILARLEEAGALMYVPNVTYYKGLSQIALGDLNGAYSTLEEARKGAQKMNARTYLWPILVALAEIATRRGDSSQAESLRQRARELVVYIADHTGSPERQASYMAQPAVKALLG